MGSFFSKPSPCFEIVVKTGDARKSGTDANVRIRLYDDASHSSEPIVLDHVFTNEFERGQVDKFEVPPAKVKAFGRNAKITRIELWRDDSGVFNNWLLDTIRVENRATGESFMFPVFRWIREHYHYHINHLDTSLPQFDEFPEQRKLELEEKRNAYEYDQKFSGGPVQVKSVPQDENFSFSYKWDIVSLKMKLISLSGIKKLLSSGQFDSLEDIQGVYDDVFPKTQDDNGWKSDVHFGFQRVASHNPSLIRLVREIPDKFPVTDEMVSGVLEGLTLKEAMDQKRLFICDYELMEGIANKEGYTTCHPLGLFFVNQADDLVPVAIQLYQKPGPSNPIFTPLDFPMLWCVVKMWYNNADAAYHQAIAHLGFTHLMMEGVTIAVHRTLSQSHPVFKLLAPHFLYIIAINARALNLLLPEGSWIDNNMNAAAVGTVELSRRGTSIWRMDVQGTLPEDLKDRGLDDPKVLPNYYFREDATDVYDVIKKYVTSYINHYYKTVNVLQGDKEIQSFAKELVGERGNQGAGFKGVPGDGQLTNTDQLVQILTSIIFTCSVTHAAVNFPQYNQYCYPPNYPALLRGEPPTSKDVTITEMDIVSALPSRSSALDIMVVTKILSTKGTQSLGDFEVQYIYDPEAIKFVEQFKQDLKEISVKIKTRNKSRKYQYNYLDPEFIPNSISI